METVAKICRDIMYYQPFYALFLCGINKRFANVGTACVSAEGINTVIQLDPEYWKSRTPDQKKATIMHEVLHIMLYHISDFKYWKAVCPDPEILNIAMDLTVESNIPEAWWDEEGITAEELFRMFPNLPKGKGTHFYLDFVKRLRQEAGLDPKSSGPQSSGPQSSGSQGGSQSDSDGASIQHCIEHFKGMSIKNQNKVKDMLTTHIDAHNNFASFLEGLSDSEKELIKTQIQHQLKETAKNTGRGLWPGSLVQELDALLKPKPPVYNWKQAFRRILGTAFDVNRKLTRRKESKRFEDAYGSKLKKKHKILVGIDTSGSVSDKDFQDFFSEIYHIYKAGSQVHILECDTQITNEYDYNGKMPQKITGRGGTILKPMYDYWNQSKDYTLFVLFTDGYCDTPVDGLKGNTISIITTGGTAIQNFPGKTIKIKPE